MDVTLELQNNTLTSPRLRLNRKKELARIRSVRVPQEQVTQEVALSTRANGRARGPRLTTSFASIVEKKAPWTRIFRYRNATPRYLISSQPGREATLFTTRSTNYPLKVRYVASLPLTFYGEKPLTLALPRMYRIVNRQLE